MQRQHRIADRQAGALGWFGAHAPGVLLAVMALLFLAAALGEGETGPGNGDRASILVARQLYAATQGTPVDTAAQLRTPGYPLILTGMALLDDDVARGLACASEPPDGCAGAFPFWPLILLQVVAAVLCLALAFRLALKLSGDRNIAIMALVLTFVWGRFGEFAGSLLPHTWYQLGVMASVYLCATAKTPTRFLAAGLCIGLTALFEPTSIALVAVALWAAARAPNTSPRVRFSYAGLVILGAVLGIVPLLTLADMLGYQNGSIARHMSWALSERAAFNRLDGAAWWAGLVLPIPMLGDLASLLFPTEVMERFGYYVPGTYVYDGANRIFPAALAQPVAPLMQTVWLAKTYILQDPIGYLAASGPMLVRGLFGAAGLIGLIGILHVPTMRRWSKLEPSYQATAITLLAAGALVVVNTLITANPVNLNPILPFVYAYAIAYVASGF